ncbi:MAG: NAD-dependent epimerase/dehydratase family protein [Bacteroidota bacterium]|nr:NAD-dependent epimerase/dehydratase family protein [Bacteroidota bacterium]
MNLVTGATGLLGSHVVLKLLQQGKTVVAAKQSSSDLTKLKHCFLYYTKDAEALFNKIKWVDLDITDVCSIENALNGIEHVYHCAGFVSFLEKDFPKLTLLNETGTANLVNACVAGKIKSFCHASSLSTINNADYEGELSEKIFWKTSGKESSYAISKYNAEREVWRGIEEGLNAVIVNPGFILAPGFWKQSSGKIFAFCKKGNMFYTDGSTAYVDVNDVVEVMLQLMDKQIFNERFILIENSYTFKDIFTQIQKKFGKPAPFIKSGIFLLQLGRIADGILSRITGKDRVLTTNTIRTAIGHKKYSNSKVKNSLSFSFKPINEVLNSICDHYENDLKSRII